MVEAATARQGYIALTLRALYDPETEQYEAHCEELDVASCGDDLDQAFANVADAVLLYLNSIEQAGERKRIFAERGIEIAGDDHGEPRSIEARPDEYVSNRLFPVAV